MNSKLPEPGPGLTPRSSGAAMGAKKEAKHNYCLVISALLGIITPVLAIMGYTVLFLLEAAETGQSLLVHNVMAVLVSGSHSINTVLHLLFLIGLLLRRNFW